LNQATIENLQLNSEAASRLIQKIGSGDQAALIALYDKTSRLLFGLIIKIVEDSTKSEEVLLEVYTRVWKLAASYDPKMLSPLEWLIMIARSLSIANIYWSKKYKRKHRLSEGSTDPAMSVAPERQQRARDSIAALIPAQREALDWAFYSGLGCNEIAAQTGKPVGAIRTHARLGLSKLEESFSPAIKNEPGSSQNLGD
jgi:RNA polymerase sigma-70 factor, ECF subfamily